MTGGDAVTARHMRQDFFTFNPTWKLLLVGNHQPSLRDVDAATRRRFNVIPFTFKPEAPDTTLEERLCAQYPSILAWTIEGARDWRDRLRLELAEAPLWLGDRMAGLHQRAR